jgi:hypothetical protein
MRRRVLGDASACSAGRLLLSPAVFSFSLSKVLLTVRCGLNVQGPAGAFGEFYLIFGAGFFGVQF